jgi:Flp pilus assembly protein TadG
MIRGALPSPTRPSLWRRLRRERDGATLAEFGLIAPVLFMMLFGIFDLAHTIYTTSMVNGAMQRAARDMTIEGATLREAQVDQRVINEVRTVVPANATVTLKKLSYFDFNDVGQPEPFTDTNNDGICNNGEPFQDTNRNGQWDANRGAVGIGGARDVVLYTVTVSYRRLFPIYALIGMPQNATVEGTTVLRNQPFDQQDRTTQLRNCS